MIEISTLPDLVGFKCQQCGKCCEWGGPSLSASKDDVERWEEEGREDILQYIDYISVKECPKCGKSPQSEKENCDTCGIKLELKVISADLWFDPVTGEELQKCPFLRKVRNKNEFQCRIHDTKPGTCKDFPIIISTKCKKCGLNFVRYFKDTELPDIPLEEYLKWSLNDFFDKVLKDIKNCPQCDEPMPMFHEWSIQNCPAVQLFLRKKDLGL